VQRLEIGIASRQRAIFRIERNGTLEMRDRLGRLVPLCVGDGKHVKRVIVVRILVADEAKMRHRLVVPPAVQRERGGVEPLADRRGSTFARADLAFTDVEIQPYTLVKFLFLRVLTKDRLQQLERRRVIVTLHRAYGAFVDGDRLEVGSTFLWRRRSAWRCLRLSWCRWM